LSGISRIRRLTPYLKKRLRKIMRIRILMEPTILTVLPETGSKTIVSGIKKCGVYYRRYPMWKRNDDLKTARPQVEEN
jgi:hypothetical protein